MHSPHTVSRHRHLIKRKGVWVFMQRVPTAYKWTPDRPWGDERLFVTETTGIRVVDDPLAKAAQGVADRITAAMIAYWEARAAGHEEAAKAWLEETCRKARAMAVTYLFSTEVAVLPGVEVFARIERLERELAILRAPPVKALEVLPGPTAVLTTSALLGGAKRVTMPLSQLATAFLKLRAATLESKSPQQRKPYRGARHTANTRFLKTVGKDVDLSELTKEHANAHRAWLEQRILAGEIVIDTATHDLVFLAAMLKEVSKANGWNLEPIFAGVAFARERRKKKGKGVAFSANWIGTKLLAPGALTRRVPARRRGFMTLSLEARCAFYLMMETGMSPSESVNLDETVIHLDENIPYVYVTALTREIKTENRDRKIPLVGVALAAMRLCPKGFQSYHDNPKKLSKDLNDYLEATGLREPRKDGKPTTVKSLRHAFKDRLREATNDEELRDVLMGHTDQKEDYGDGFYMEKKKQALDKIAFQKYPADL
jgi:hypothetical protein